MKKTLTVCFVSLLALTIACDLSYFEDAEFSDSSFDPSIAVVFGELTYTVSDLFEQLNSESADIEANQEGVVTLGFQEELQSQSAADFLTISDLNFQGSLPGGVTINNPVGGPTVTVPVTQSFEFNLSQQGGEALDSVDFSAGNFGFTVQSDFNTTINYTATFKSLAENGTPLTVTGTLNPASNSNTVNVNLSTYVGLFNKDANGNAASNKFLLDVSYDVVIAPGSGVTSTDEITFNGQIQNSDFETVYGQFGTKQLEVGLDNIDFGIFDQFGGDGNITFNDPQFTFVFNNSFGFPLGIDFQSLSVLTSDGQTINLEGDIINQLNVVEAPTVANRGTTTTTEITLNKDNSNIAELLSAKPETLIINVSASSNPAGAPAQYNFIGNTGELGIGVNVEIPLDITIDGLTVTETVPFSPPEDIDQAKGLLLRLISENELPLSGIVGIEFLDDQGAVVYSLDAQTAFDAAELGNDGRTAQPAAAVADFRLDESAVQSIQNSSQINLVVRLSTTGATQGVNVKLFEDYELVFKVAGQLDLNISSNDN